MFMVSACCWRGRLCFGRGRDRGFILYISLFLRVRVVGGWVLVIRAHTHKLLGYFSLEKSRRCDDNQQTSATHFGENNRLDCTLRANKITTL